MTITIAAAALVAPATFLASSPAGATASPPYLTLLFARSQWQATDDCSAPLPNSVTLQDVANDLQSRGLTGTAAVVTTPTQQSTRYCQTAIAYQASWDDLANLRDNYGWQAISTGAQHLDMTTLTPDQAYAESCGSLAPLTAHGFTRANGLFGYGNNMYNDQLQTDIVSTCFQYGRRYVTPTSPAVNTRSTTVAPWYAWALSVNGGACNDTAAACYDEDALGVTRRYMSPDYIASVMNDLPDQWAIVQTYRFVTGSHDAAGPGGAAWDCTDPNWQEHWTNEAEIYCMNDFDHALDQLSSSVQVTDPATVAADWGRNPPPPDTTKPTGAIVNPPQDHAFLPSTISVTGTAADNAAVAEVDVYFKNRDTGLIWHTNGTWTSQFQWQKATIDDPGGQATNWSYDWPATTTGNYSIGFRVRDTSGNIFSGALTRFTVVNSSSSGVTLSLTATLGGPLHYDIYPSGIDVAPDGTIVIADTGNDMVKKFDRQGNLIWAIGGYGSGVNEFYEPRDVGIDSAGDIFVVDTRNSRIVKLDSAGDWITSFKGPAGDLISFPLGLSVHNDQVVLADLGKKKVRVFDLNGNQVQTVVANGACSNLNGIRDADRDNEGNFYVAGYSTNQILKFDSTGTCVKVWGGAGTANGKFKTPYGVKIAFDPIRNAEAVYVADALNDRMQEFTTGGVFITKFGTFGTFDQPGTLNNLRRVSVDTNGSGDVWAADLWGDRIEQWHRTSTGYTFVQQIGVEPPPTTDTNTFHEPRQVAFSPDGTLNVVDTVHHRFVRMTPQGHVLSTCGTRGSGQGQFNWPRGIAVDPTTGQIWVADTKANRIQIMNPDCTFVTSFGSLGTGPAQFNWPSAIAIRSDGIAFIIDTQNNRVKAYNVATRTYLGSFLSVGAGQNQVKTPLGVAVDPTDGHIFIGDTGNNRLIELQSANGTSFSVVRYIGGYVSGPENLAVDSGGRVFATDSNDNQVAVLDPGGALDQYLSSPQMFHPASVSIGPDGQVYVSDTYNDRILVYSEEQN